jgi:hypothetical protein
MPALIKRLINLTFIKDLAIPISIGAISISALSVSFCTKTEVENDIRNLKTEFVDSIPEAVVTVQMPEIWVVMPKIPRTATFYVERDSVVAEWILDLEGAREDTIRRSYLLRRGLKVPMWPWNVPDDTIRVNVEDK